MPTILNMPIRIFTYNQLSFFRILNPGSATPTLGQQIALDVPSYADPANAPHKGNLYTLKFASKVPHQCYVFSKHGMFS